MSHLDDIEDGDALQDADVIAQAKDDALALLRMHPTEFQVQTRMPLRSQYNPPDGSPVGRLVIVDTEGTGLKPGKPDTKLAQLSMLMAEYGKETGKIYRVAKRAFNQIQDPGIPMPLEASLVNGLYDEHVRGKPPITPEAIAQYIKGADLFIAHNAEYDYGMLADAFGDLFTKLPWGDTLHDIDWRKHYGVAARDVRTLMAFHAGEFTPNLHDAEEDCRATLNILATPSKEGRMPLLDMMHSMSQEVSLIAANNAPFEKKEDLKARGYKWNPGDADSQYKEFKAWWKKVPAEERDTEMAFLATSIYRTASAPPVLEYRMNALTRYTKPLVPRTGRDAPSSESPWASTALLNAAAEQIAAPSTTAHAPERSASGGVVSEGGRAR